jgi:hypothetical protein
MRRKALPLLLSATLLLGAGVACDKEDRKDAREVGNDIDNGVDKLDTDGKDD